MADRRPQSLRRSYLSLSELTIAEATCSVGVTAGQVCVDIVVEGGERMDLCEGAGRGLGMSLHIYK